MSERPQHQNPSPPDPSVGLPIEATPLGELHRVGEDLLAAGDEAIRRALSGDSEAFLRANRQKGGQ
jgi:hypothetical protein